MLFSNSNQTAGLLNHYFFCHSNRDEKSLIKLKDTISKKTKVENAINRIFFFLDKIKVIQRRTEVKNQLPIMPVRWSFCENDQLLINWLKWSNVLTITNPTTIDELSANRSLTINLFKSTVLIMRPHYWQRHCRWYQSR